MRLLIVCQAVDSAHPNLGFFVRWIAEFAKHADVVVIANEVGEHALPANVTVHSLGKERGVGRIGRYATFFSLITSLQYDEVFCHMNPEFVIAGSAWWLPMQKRVILWYVHGKVSLRLRFALAFVHRAATVNAESLRIRSPKVVYLGHGIDTEYYKPGYRLRHDEHSVLTVGRIAPSKRLELVIEAVRTATSLGVPIRASIIGGAGVSADSEYAERVRREAEAANIRYLGPQSTDFVRDAVSAADLFLNVSTTNSVDKAVLEAMAGGTVPITTNPAFRAILEPLGLFVADATPEALAVKIEEVLQRPDFEELRTQVREEVVKNHNLVHCVGSILATYGV
ncbi:MAG: glycosyltransferase family 4 protein [Patescibacteria group bacterium]